MPVASFAGSADLAESAQRWTLMILAASKSPTLARCAFVVPRLMLTLTLALGASACSPAGGPPPPAYISSCAPCHGEGLGGAPRVGVASDWEPRIAGGVEKVRRNAIVGIEGSTGVMPPKGGRTDLTDDEIGALVDYMIEASR
jgi:cytochrome c5